MQSKTGKDDSTTKEIDFYLWITFYEKKSQITRGLGIAFPAYQNAYCPDSHVLPPCGYPIVTFSLPTTAEDESTSFYIEQVSSAEVFSTYPIRPLTVFTFLANSNLIALQGQRYGDPICDFSAINFYQNRVVASLADGCIIFLLMQEPKVFR